MATVSRFEDLVVWQKARAMTRRIYQIAGQGSFAKDFGLRDQVQRAAVSIGSNVAEGFERGGRKEFIQYLSLAKGSAGELRSQVHTASDLNYITEAVCTELLRDLEEISRILAAFIKRLQKSSVNGPKFKSSTEPAAP